MKLPSMTHEFHLNTKGEDTQLPFQGRFTYKRPTLGQRRQIKIHEDSLNNGSGTLDEETRALNMVLAWLQNTLIEYPDWWQGGFDMYDANVIFEIYEEIVKFEDEYRKKIEQMGKNGEKE